jgi:hypothetical protein
MTYLLLAAALSGWFCAWRAYTSITRYKKLVPELCTRFLETEARPDRVDAIQRQLARIQVLQDSMLIDSGLAETLRAVTLLPKSPRSLYPYLTTEVRQAHEFQYARWDGMGLPPGIAEHKIPIASQWLSWLAWMETRLGSNLESWKDAFQEEANNRFSAELVALVLPQFEALALSSNHAIFQKSNLKNGALMAALPSLVSRSSLLALELELRRTLRGGDRIIRTTKALFIWMPECSVEGAAGTQNRLEKLHPALKLGVNLLTDKATPFEEAAEQALKNAIGLEAVSMAG